MKKKYIKPHTKVIELNFKPQLLIGSGDRYYDDWSDRDPY